MSTTLTNGLKLPDKGSVDWYADMQNNYAILDGAVGTIAEHTSALSGKAPLVHTHTKSDVTDLFNSANVWTGDNSYTGVVSLNSSSDVAEQFKQKLPKDVSTSNDAMARVNTLVDSAGHYVVVETLGHWANYVAKNITLKYKNDSTKQGAIEFRLYSDGSGIFYAQAPFECDLGNSYNKWKTLNGINPGALSLPNYNSADPIDFRQWSTTGGMITYTPTVSGWLQITVSGGSGCYITILDSGTNPRAGQRITGDGIDRLFSTYPVIANRTYWIYIVSSAIETARIIPCLGNV